MRFPDAWAPTDEGLIAVGGDLAVPTLLEAYRKGIFPWPQEGLPLLWFSPEERGILEFAEFHVPESLRKFARKNPQLQFTINQAFAEVMAACRSQVRAGQAGTWILPEMLEAYQNLFAQGYALSLECWNQDQLVGGIYGVLVDGLFSGESMFHLQANISKMCVWKMVEHLRTLGHQWMDIQMVTPVMAAFGGKCISRAEFLQKKGIPKPY